MSEKCGQSVIAMKMFPPLVVMPTQRIVHDLRAL